MEPIDPSIGTPPLAPRPVTSGPADPDAATAVKATSSAPSVLGGARRTLATLALAAGLLVVGGTAVVLAASPEPSATPAPTTETQPSTGGSTAPTDHVRGDCPDRDGNSGSNGSSGSDSDDSSAPSSPSADPTPTPASESEV